MQDCCCRLVCSKTQLQVPPGVQLLLLALLEVVQVGRVEVVLEVGLEVGLGRAEVLQQVGRSPREAAVGQGLIERSTAA
jgi:hypothetical protein